MLEALSRCIGMGFFYVFSFFASLGKYISKMSSKQKKNREIYKEEDILHALVIADSFNTRFSPVTLEKPTVRLILNGCCKRAIIQNIPFESDKPLFHEFLFFSSVL